MVLGQEIGVEPSPLCEWLLRRECAYWETHHWPDWQCAYAAARDVACWQLNRNEVAMLEVVTTLEQATNSEQSGK
jgi:hypothetical protein